MNRDLPLDLVSHGFRLEGITAIVSGAGSIGPGFGIGRAAAILLADAGARVAVIDQNILAAEETVALIREREGLAYAYELDVTDEQQVKHALAEIHTKFGSIGVLVNNVGIVGPPGTVESLDLDRWEEAMRINVTSMVIMSRHTVPYMRERGGGSIVNISSLAGVSAGYPSALYPTSKGAVLSLTRAMAAHHGSDHIRVNAVLPGPLFTPRIEVRNPTEEMRKRRADLNLLGTEGTGWDAAYAVLYLAAEASRWVTGTSLLVDAGLAVSGPSDSPASG